MVKQRRTPGEVKFLGYLPRSNHETQFHLQLSPQKNQAGLPQARLVFYLLTGRKREIYMGLVAMPDSSPRNFQGEGPVASEPVS